MVKIEDVYSCCPIAAPIWAVLFLFAFLSPFSFVEFGLFSFEELLPVVFLFRSPWGGVSPFGTAGLLFLSVSGG